MLEAQWPERMERTLEETVAGLAARLEEEHQDALEARVQQAQIVGRDGAPRADPETEPDHAAAAWF